MSEVNELVHSLAPAIPDWSMSLIPDCIHTVYRMQTNDALLHLPARKTQHAFSRLCHLLFLCRSSVLLHDAFYGVFRAKTKMCRPQGFGPPSSKKPMAMLTAVSRSATSASLANPKTTSMQPLCRYMQIDRTMRPGYAILTLQRMRISTISGHVCPYHNHFPACQGPLSLCRSTLRRRSKLSVSDSFG